MHFAALISATVVIASLAASFHASAQTSTPRPARSASSQPAPAAAGPLRILLVDDDFSDNNNNPGDSRQTPSDRIFRQVVADAVGGNAKSWEIEYVKPYASGPGIERLRPFSVIVWYTGAIYGGNPDNSGVLSIEDEKTVRRYLQEVGGTVILFSPGYLSKVLGASGTWEKTDWKFLTEVVGARGGHGLAQRFLPGVVTAPDGARFNVDKGSAVESQFSLVNPGGAAVLFSTVPASAKPGSAAAPVATSHAYGKGRFIYVGFSFENLAAAEHAPAFRKLLAAAGSQASPAMSVSRTQPQEKRQAADSAPGISVQVSGSQQYTRVQWTLQTGPAVNAAILGPEQTARKAPAGKAPAAPAPGPTVTVRRYEKYANGTDRWDNVNVWPGYAEVVDHHEYGASAVIERRYRLTVTEAGGATSVKEVQTEVKPVRDPASLTATVQGDRSIVLSWPEVPGVTKYEVLGYLPNRRGVIREIVTGATEWRSQPLGGAKRYWEVASLFRFEYMADNYEVAEKYVTMGDDKNRPWAETESDYPNEYFLTVGTLTIHTGNDNKEAPSHFQAKLWVNGGQTNTDGNPQYQQLNPHNLQEVAHFDIKAGELKVNSSADFKLPTRRAHARDLATVQQHGLRLVIKYFPNFPLDAWKIERVALTVSFQNAQKTENKTMTFSNVNKLLTESASQLDLVADGSFRPIP